MRTLRKLAIASVILFGGIAAASSAPLILQDQAGERYIENEAGTWVLYHQQGKGDRLQLRGGTPLFTLEEYWSFERGSDRQGRGGD